MLRPIVMPLAFSIFLALFATVAVGMPAQTGKNLTSKKSQIALGQREFIRCASCHAIDGSTGGKIGPQLRGVIGRRAGSVAGYAYSPAMKASNIIWNEAKLDLWLTKPNAVVPGTSMAFAGLPKAADRKAVIAYLKNLGAK